jgi:hypothetical protein
LRGRRGRVQLRKDDVRHSALNLRRNLKHVRHWLEQEQALSAAASKV